MTWRIDDVQGEEAAKVKYLVVPFTRGIVLDFGCGPHKPFPHWIGVDSCKDTQLFGIHIKPDVACDVADPVAVANAFNTESVDAVFSSHCLEHIENYHAALAAWWSLIKPGGHLVLYLPHRDLYPNIGEPGANPDHKHDFAPADVITALQEHTDCMDVLVNETRDQGNEYSFLLVVRKTAQPHVGAYSWTLPRPEKTACVVRYGGFGDMLQAANILPALKREGWHVTVMTTPKGKDIIAQDPHVDAWFIQDDNQVPNHELTDFWSAHAARFDRFINLSESVEATLLTFEGRISNSWPDAVRRVELNKNYLEWISRLAEVPYVSEARFYETDAERLWANGFIADLRIAVLGREPLPLEHVPATFNIMWCLAGSSIHKMYPHQDTVIATILDAYPHATVTLVGDPLCKLLEAGWENHPRVKCMSGELSIRSTLALARLMDCVVGPETGVLNSVAFEDMGKVCMLSHSSHENLTKHWVHTVAVEPSGTDCYPCHRLHHTRKFCREHVETGAAMCAFNTDPQHVASAIAGFADLWALTHNLRRAA